MKIRYLVLAMIAAMALSLGAVACGSDDDGGDGNGGGGSDADSEQVAALVLRQGELISRGEWRDLWETLTPLTRENCTYEDFLSGIQLDRIFLGDLETYRNKEIEVELAGNTAFAKYVTELEGSDFSAEEKDVYVKLNGQWYDVDEESSVCPDSGEDSNKPAMTEYFTQLATLGQAFDADGEALDEQASEDFDGTESEEDAIELFVSFIEDTASLVDDFVDGIDNLNAPAEAASAHGEAVTAGHELGDMYDNVLTVVDTAETFEEATLVLEGPGFIDAAERFGNACVALQGIADSNGIEADLACPSDF